MTASERRKEILDTLNMRRHEKIDNFAFELQVSRRTIERDIFDFLFNDPASTENYTGGGVHVIEGRYIYDINRMNDEQTELLERLLNDLTGKDAEIMKTILKKYSR